VSARTVILDVLVPQEWERIETVREAVLGCAFDGDGDVHDAMAMACAELLENAIKYGAPGPVHVRISSSSDELILEVTNAVAAACDSAAALEQKIAWLSTFDSAEEAYMAALAAVALREPSSSSGESGLGLVRIAYEGGLRLSVEVATASLTVCAKRNGSANGGAS